MNINGEYLQLEHSLVTSQLRKNDKSEITQLLITKCLFTQNNYSNLHLVYWWHRQIVQLNKKVKQHTYSMSFNIHNKEITQVLKTHDMTLLADEY